MSHPNDPNQVERPPAPASVPAGLLLKLVLLPGLFVAVIVICVLIITGLTTPADDVDAMIETLAEEGRNRWPAALSLATVLHGPGNETVKRDPAIALRLGAILQKEMDTGRMDPDHIRLRMYLCRALGEFHVEVPLPTLVRAARTERDRREVDVRRSAIEALAVLASNADPPALQADDSLISALEEAAGHRDASVGGVAAFALGVIGGDRARQRLESLLTAASPEVRYNAATGLARHGDARCVDVLVEMLDPKRPNLAKDASQSTIVLNGIRAAGQLAAANQRADLGDLTAPVERLTEKGVPAAIRVEATEVLHALRLRDVDKR